MTLYNIALSLTPRLGNRTIKVLIDEFFSAENIFSQSLENLVGVGLREDAALAIVNRVAFDDAKEQMKHCERHGIEVLCYVDEFYPPQLREITDPPFVLYLQGSKEVLTRNIISFIGTRKSSSYGERTTHTLIKDLSDRVHNLVIASGLALGIDSIAHRAALSIGVPTIAFVPTALPTIVPSMHGNLARDIIEDGGAILSEVASVTKVSNSKPLYMQRNRIVVGVAGATIVVESGFGGGAYKAALNAIDEGLLIGAVPGRLGDAGSYGCNILLSTKSAFMVMNSETIIRELGWEDRRLADFEGRVDVRKSADSNRCGDFSLEQLTLLRAFSEDEAFHISDLQKTTDFPVGVLSAMLIELTILEVVKSLPGSLYERLIPLSDIKE